jgi:hypothetical protein
MTKRVWDEVARWIGFPFRVVVAGVFVAWGSVWWIPALLLGGKETRVHVGECYLQHLRWAYDPDLEPNFWDDDDNGSVL